MAEMTLSRRWYSGASTIGLLALGDFHCVTLEDRVRAPGVKVQDKTAIPAGRYRVIVNQSIRFGRPMPLLIDVPMFTGIRIHPGNCEYDTMGCILVGRSRMVDWITNSKVTFDALFPLIQAGAEDLWITITDEPVQDLRTPEGA